MIVHISGNVVSSLKKSFLSSSSIFKNSFCGCVFHDLCEDPNIRKNPLFSRIISLFSLDSGCSADRFRVDGEEYLRMPDDAVGFDEMPSVLLSLYYL